jgi:DNA (cytosine-5)-methyltransferase 1
MTIALSNFDVEKNDKNIEKWRVTVFYGTGEGFGIKEYEEGYYKKIEKTIIANFNNGAKFIEYINFYLSNKVAGRKMLQEMYENNKSIDAFLEPTKLIEDVSIQINKFCKKEEQFVQIDQKIFSKSIVPKKQLYALYALNLIISITNNK